MDNVRSILIKIKGWLEVRMQSSPFLNICIGVAIVILSIGGATWLGSSVILALLN